MSSPERILEQYQRLGPDWARRRDRRLTEKRWLDRMISFAPLTGRRRSLLDLGCGAGLPVAGYLVDRGLDVTGVDGAAAMLALFRRNVPAATAIEADMRGLSLGRTFDAILSWDSFFHLSAQHQRDMFATFAAHLNPRGVVMVNTGPDAGEALGDLEGEPLYHASLSPDDYRDAMAAAGFSVIDFVPEDDDCNGRSIWLIRKTTGA